MEKDWIICYNFDRIPGNTFPDPEEDHSMFDTECYAQLARQAAREGAVLLKNDNHTLPLKSGTRVASFGRSQLNYFKSGTGSGGLVNAPYVVSILDAMLASDDVRINETVLNTYTEWVKSHPFDEGHGWATEPWSQEEMPLDEQMVINAAQESEVAVVTIARTAGEDRDNSPEPGSYLLSDAEERMLELVCRHFPKTVVLLNTGNIIDMKWVKQYDPSAVLYVWQGGQEGGNGVLDLLLGADSPSGKLADTIAWDISDYPSTKDFGDPDRNFYREDIYVGYRYFETFAKDRVLYPFGFGLSYTTFARKAWNFTWNGTQVALDVTVTNTGTCSGREVVQLYASAPQGKMGKPSRVLCGFAKTRVLEPGDSQTLHIVCRACDFASYDDTGASGFAHAWVLEAGEYGFYLGGDVRSAEKIGSVVLGESLLVEQLSEAMSPVIPFQRLRPIQQSAKLQESWEQVPLRSYDLWERIDASRPKDIPITGDRGYRLADVRRGLISMEDFVAQIPVDQLCVLLRGEGMSSPKVTPGTGGAFGGLSPELQKLGIPIACCTDGPSGIRMDSGALATSIPNGTCLGCSFNTELMEALFDMMGMELRKNNVETLLGPGINLHRNPLNGRNFEYVSEDPILGGRIAAAQLRGMHRHNVTGTIKHFAGNNQEYRRHFVDAVVSERALRELYLKSFEIAVKEGGAYSIMSTYGPVNGLFTASNYDLLTHILRGEWGYQGIVMSDWWAKGNEEGEPGEGWEVAAMVRSQNDLNMVTEDAQKNSRQDNLNASANTHKMTLGDMQRSAMNILRVLMQSPAMDRYLGEEEAFYRNLREEDYVFTVGTEQIVWDLEQGSDLPVERIAQEKDSRTVIRLQNLNPGRFSLKLKLHSESEAEWAQLPMYVYLDGNLCGSICLTGADRVAKAYSVNLGEWRKTEAVLAFFVKQSGLKVDECRVVSEIDTK